MRFLIRSIVAVALLFAVSSYHNPSSAFAGEPEVAVADSALTIQSLVAFANKHLHIPYRSGGSSKRGFDCSGFVRYCFNKWNISLPHSSAAQAKHGETVSIDDAKPGDLIFFKGESSRSSRIGHVGIITEVAPGYVKFIHSAFKGGIRYDLLHASYYSKRFVAIKRLVDRE
jgi:cell wall-associated NlpC family hydrolase